MELNEQIEKIESTITNLKDAIEAIKDVPYYEYLIAGWERDLMELEGTLDDLLEKQDLKWTKEINQLSKQYFKSVI